MKTSLRSLAVHSHFCHRLCDVLLALACVAFSASQAQTTNYALGATALLVGPDAGIDSVALSVEPATTPWMAVANAAWLHIGPANRNDTGGKNVIFSFDSNQGATRFGTLTIGNQPLTITQAGSTYVAAGQVTTLVSLGLDLPRGVAVDGAGNVYFANYRSNTIQEWKVAGNTVITLVSAPLSPPASVAVDAIGNVYFSDPGSNAIQKWTAANSNVTTLVSSGLAQPGGVAVDASGNVYIADTLNNAIKEWTAANSNVITLVSGGLGLELFSGLAVDRMGNVYIADTLNNAIKEWIPANGYLTTLVSGPSTGTAVDGSGNVYVGSFGFSGEGVYGGIYGMIKKWAAANNNVTTLVSSNLSSPYSASRYGVALYGLAADGSGNVYIADSGANAIKELPHAFVDPSPKLETATAGNDALPVVLPATANLLTPFTPTSDQPWLTITGVTNGVVSFSFDANTGSPIRTAHITLLGQTIPVTQGGVASYSLGIGTVLEGPTTGSNNVVLYVNPNYSAWSNTGNASSLNSSLVNPSGTGSTNAVFSPAPNPSATH